MKKRKNIAKVIVIVMFMTTIVLGFETEQASAATKFTARLSCFGASKTIAMTVYNKTSSTLVIYGDAAFISNSKSVNAYAKAMNVINAGTAMFARNNKGKKVNSVSIKAKKKKTIYFKSSNAKKFTSKAGLGYNFKYRGHYYIAVSTYKVSVPKIKKVR